MVDNYSPRSPTDAILATLAYFDVFEYPLTAVEAHKFLWQQKATLGDVVAELEAMETAGTVSRQFGYYCLPGREALVETRWQRYLLAEKKYQRALMAASWLRLVPNIRIAAVCNNLAYSNARAESDVDLFIVTAPHRIWLTRLLVTLVVQLLGLRRYGDKIADRCCLSFYLTADASDLKPFALTPDDPYLCYWLATLAVIYARPGAAEEFWRANDWVKNFLPNFRPRVMNGRRTIPPVHRSSRLATAAGDWLNQIAKHLQLAKMAARERNRQRGVGVVVSDRVLKFHEEDRRAQYRQEWRKRLTNYELRITNHG